MTISSRLGAILRLSLASALAACLLWPGTTAPINQLKTSSTVNPLPELRGQAAVEHLKREGIYASLAEAVKASLYKAEALPSGDAYRFSNPAQGLRATFTPSGARVASSRGGRELVIKPIGYGYGRRMTRLDSQKIVARGSRIEHEYALKESAIRNPQSAIRSGLCLYAQRDELDTATETRGLGRRCQRSVRILSRHRRRHAGGRCAYRRRREG
jgi:hypothetical protein